MQTYPAKQAKNKFGEMIDNAQREPIKITRNNRPVAFVLSAKEYEELDAIRRANALALLDSIQDDAENSGLTQDTLNDIVNEQ